MGNETWSSGLFNVQGPINLMLSRGVRNIVYAAVVRSSVLPCTSAQMSTMMGGPAFLGIRKSLLGWIISSMVDDQPVLLTILAHYLKAKARFIGLGAAELLAKSPALMITEPRLTTRTWYRPNLSRYWKSAHVSKSRHDSFDNRVPLLQMPGYIVRKAGGFETRREPGHRSNLFGSVRKA